MIDFVYHSHYALLNSTDGAALTIVPYILCRLSLAVSYFVYSFSSQSTEPNQDYTQLWCW